MDGELQEHYVDLLEAGRRLGIHPGSVRRIVKNGKLPAFRFGGKWLIEADKLEMFKSTYRPYRGAPRKLL